MRDKKILGMILIVLSAGTALLDLVGLQIGRIEYALLAIVCLLGVWLVAKGSTKS